RANVSAAEATRAASELKVKRLSELSPEVGLRKELDEAQMQLKSARAAVEAAEARVREADEAEKVAQYGLDMTMVRARAEPAAIRPAAEDKSAFIIIDRKVTLGQLISPPLSAHLFTLAGDLNWMELRTQVSESDIGKVHPGQTVSFTVYAYPEEDIRFD